MIAKPPFVTPSAEFFHLPHRTGERIARESPPVSIVEDGRIHLGMYAQPVRRMNLHAAKLLQRTRRFLPVPSILIEWVGAGMAHPDWYFGMIIVDAKIFSLAVFYGFHRKTGQTFPTTGSDCRNTRRSPKQPGTA